MYSHRRHHRLLDSEDWAGGSADDGFGAAPHEEPAEAAAAVRPHHDEVDVL